MSHEEIIRRWKSDAPPPSGDVPANPAGDAELVDAELEQVAGGVAGQLLSTELLFTGGCCPNDMGTWAQKTVGCCGGGKL